MLIFVLAVTVGFMAGAGPTLKRGTNSNFFPSDPAEIKLGSNPLPVDRLPLIRERRFRNCPLSTSNSTHFIRIFDCENRWFHQEWATYATKHHYHVTGLHDFLLPHRNFFPQLLNALNLKGNALEIGVQEGHFSKHFLNERWAGKQYHGIDPLPLEPQTKEWLDQESRYEFHSGYDYEHVKSFEDGYFDFIYIDSVHNYPSVRDTIARWLPKVRNGGILAGHDFCRARDHQKESQVNLWPPGDHSSDLNKAPYCGHYLCGESFCYGKDLKRLGQSKQGFGGVVIAVVEAIRRANLTLHITLDGRMPGSDFMHQEGPNPSWWVVKE